MDTDLYKDKNTERKEEIAAYQHFVPLLGFFFLNLFLEGDKNSGVFGEGLNTYPVQMIY